MMLVKLVEATTREGWEHHVISLRGEGALGERLRAAGAVLTALDMPRGLPSWSGGLKLRRAAARWMPAVIQGWMYHGNLAALVASTNGAPVVWNVRQSLPSMEHERPLTRAVIRMGAALSSRPRAILYNSRAGARDHENFGYLPERTQVIPNGFDTMRFRPDPSARTLLLEQLGLPADARLIGMFARSHPLKDHATLLKAMADLASERPDLHLVLAGTGMNADHPLLAPAGLDPRLAGRVHALGERRDIDRLMPGLDIAVLSSLAEGFPNVVGEAMACGIPCVATDVGDVADVLGDTGLVVPPSDHSALGRALEALLDEPRVARETRTIAARASIETRFSLKSVADRYSALYRSFVT